MTIITGFTAQLATMGVELEKSEFENYKSIAEINSAFLEEMITEEERVKELELIYKNIDKVNSEKRETNINESKEWVDLVRTKSNDELYSITNEKRREYNPAFIIAAEMEIEKRNKK